MKVFKSTIAGKEHAWELSLTFGAVIRVRAAVGVNLLDPEKADENGITPFIAMRQDLEKFVDAVWELVKSQAESAGVDAEAFAVSLDPKSFQQCREAFFGEWVDFFLASGVPEKASAIKKQMELFGELAAKLETIPAASLMAPIETALQSLMSSPTSTNSPA